MIKKNLIWIALLLASLLFVAGCGGGESTGATAEKRPPSDPPLFHQKEYDVNTTWNQETSDRKVGSYLESVWHDPASFSSKTIIDSRPAAGAPPPMTAAELSRAQANWLPNYRERSLKRVKLGPRSMIRWAYFAAGRDRIEYFFEECGTSIMFRGSTIPLTFKPFSEFYGIIASRIKALCAE
ncbi:MAG TPA: hypothetical protein VH042_11165 [Solirubrobacterales bacterium]|jgi:hypothetical protein|nr:hypothetical protein [Solirubrobacterales bacterium]